MAFFGLYLGCQVLGILGAVMIWLFSLGSWLGGPSRFIEWNAALQRAWSQALFRGSFFVFSMELDVSGLEHADAGPFLLFVRHSSAADTVLAAGLVANPQRRLLRYVLKRQLLWDPCLDIVGCRLPNAFIDRAAQNPAEELDEIKRLTHDLGPMSGVLIYPEGTRFTTKKLARSIGKLREKGWTELVSEAERFESVLPPRLAGPLALIEAAPELDLLFLEHTGFEGAATFDSFWSGQLVGRRVHVRLRRITAAEIPSEGRELWLFRQWKETDRWVTSVYPKTFPGRTES